MTDDLGPLELDDKPPIDHGLIKRICVIQTALFILASLGLVKGVFRFEKIFKDFDAELPLPTQYFINIANFYAANWWLCVPVWMAVVGAQVMLVRTQCADLARKFPLAIVIGYGFFFALLVFAMFLPLVALIQKLS